jgi:hypothetical protein
MTNDRVPYNTTVPTIPPAYNAVFSSTVQSEIYIAHRSYAYNPLVGTEHYVLQMVEWRCITFVNAPFFSRDSLKIDSTELMKLCIHYSL